MCETAEVSSYTASAVFYSVIIMPFRILPEWMPLLRAEKKRSLLLYVQIPAT